MTDIEDGDPFLFDTTDKQAKGGLAYPAEASTGFQFVRLYTQVFSSQEETWSSVYRRQRGTQHQPWLQFEQNVIGLAKSSQFGYTSRSKVSSPTEPNQSPIKI